VLTSPRALCVLVVDDCPDTVASCAELLELYGHDARTAECASEALALLDGWEPDVALVDLWMPGTSGFELARRLRVRGARCPLLVAVTGLDTKTYRDRAEEVGFDHFLVKPVDPDLITDLLRIYGARLVGHDPERGGAASAVRSGAGIC
jgi:CheY-like chemotaxis protein